MTYALAHEVQRFAEIGQVPDEDIQLGGTATGTVCPEIGSDQ